MTESEVRSILRRAFNSKQAIKTLEYKIKELESLRERVTPSYSSVPGGGSGNKIEDTTEKICEMQQRLRTKTENFLKDVERAEALITFAERENPGYGVILNQRYIIGFSWWDIADINNYSRRQVFNIHNKAVKYIADSMKTLH